MQVTAKRISIKPKFEPLKISIVVETEAELALLLTQTGCSAPSGEFNQFQGTGFYHKLKVSRTEFENAQRPYSKIRNAVREEGIEL